MLGARLHLCKETIGHLQEIKGNQFTKGDKEKIRFNSVVNSLSSEYMVYSKLFFVSKFMFCIMIFAEILILPKEGIRLEWKFLTILQYPLSESLVFIKITKDFFTCQ